MIIILLPTYNSADIFDLWAEAIYNLEPKPDKVVFCENNSTDSTLQKLREFKLPHEIIRFFVRKNAAKENPYVVIAHARQLLLTRARQINPSFAIMMDDDIISESPNMLTLLTSWNKMLNAHVVGGSYLRNFAEGTFIAAKWLTPHKGHYRYYRCVPHKLLSEPHVTSSGCLCLSRRIIQDRRVNYFPLFKPQHCSEDFGFCLSARAARYKIYLDHTVKLRHIKRDRKVSTDRPWTIISKEEGEEGAVLTGFRPKEWSGYVDFEF